MDLMNIVERLPVYHVDKLGKRIDLDWVLNNYRGLMGISNRQFLCNYIEDNMDRPTEIMNDDYIQDILAVYRLDYKSLKTPDFSKVKRLPGDYQRVYYALIGRIDRVKKGARIILQYIEFYRYIVSYIFGYNIETLSNYRVYSLVRLLGGSEPTANIFPALSSFLKDKEYIQIFVEYYSEPSNTNAGQRYITHRYLAIALLLMNDLENFKLLYEMTKMNNFLRPSDQKYYEDGLSYKANDTNELNIVKKYGQDLMSLICALGKFEFLKYLLTTGDEVYQIIEYKFGHNRVQALVTEFGNEQGLNLYPNLIHPIPKFYMMVEKEVPGTLPKYSIETYLSTCLKHGHYDMAKFMLDNGYPLFSDDTTRYEVLTDIRKNLQGNIAMRDKFIQYVMMNSRLIQLVFASRRSRDQIRKLVQDGANPNVMAFINQGRIGNYLISTSLVDKVHPLIHYSINSIVEPDFAEFMLSLGADINARDREGNNCISYLYDLHDIQLCKRLGADFNQLNYIHQTPLMSYADRSISKLNIVLALINETKNLDQRDKIRRESYLFTLLDYKPPVEIIDKFKLEIFNFTGLDAAQYYTPINIGINAREHLFMRGCRGVLAYKEPMFYILPKNSDCPNEETVGLVETNNPEGDYIIAFRDMGYSDITHRHKQEPMCIAVSEIRELYFKLRPGTEEFEWNLPTTRNTHRLGSDQVESRGILIHLIETLYTGARYLPEGDPRKESLNTIALALESDVNNHFITRDKYYTENIELFNELNENQHRILDELLIMVFKLGEFMRRWGGDDEETTLKLYGKADNFPYPMQLTGPNMILMSDKTSVNLLDAYNKHILIRSRDYPKDAPQGIVPYAEDMSAEQLSVIDHFINNYFSIKDNEDVLNNKTTNISDLLTFIRKSTRLDLRILLIEIDPNLPVADILAAVENKQPLNTTLTVAKVYEHMQNRIQEITPLEKFYKNIYEYTMSRTDLSIITTNRRLYHTLDAIRPRRNGTVDEAALGDCIQLKNQDFILTAYQYFITFKQAFPVEGFSIGNFRPMHY